MTTEISEMIDVVSFLLQGRDIHPNVRVDGIEEVKTESFAFGRPDIPSQRNSFQFFTIFSCCSGNWRIHLAASELDHCVPKEEVAVETRSNTRQ